MRIKGFPGVALQDSSPYYLENCNVIIDAHNYLHNIYENSKLPFVFGCEADRYAMYLKFKLRMFKEAKVKCIFVFKGGDSDIEKKIKKMIRLVYDLKTDTYVQPIFTKDVNQQTVKEMDFDYAYCVFEAKDECVALAQKLRCPIISNDIEFCFRKAPYISSRSMIYDKNNKTISCRQFKLQDYIRKYSLTEEKLAIFATLNDTSLFEEKYFDPVFNTWGVAHTNLTLQIHKLNIWLSKHTEKEAVDTISKFLSEDDLVKFNSNYIKILNNMREDQTGLVIDYLVNSSRMFIARQDPAWFEKGVTSKRIPPVYINLYKWNVIEGSWAIEDKSPPDSCMLSINIIKYAYNLMKNFKGGSFKLYLDADNAIEVDSVDCNVKKPSYNCEVSVFENGWDGVKDLRLFEHFLSENNINVKLLDDVPAPAAVLLIALVYCKKQMKEVEVIKEVYAIMLSFVMLNVFNRQNDVKNFNVDDEDYEESKRVTKDYFVCKKFEEQVIFDGAALKRLVQFQYCINHMSYLNILCDLPFSPTSYSRVYNGTFVFKILNAMKEEDHDVFVNTLLAKAPSVLSLFKRFIKFYNQLADSN